ncbi:MAG: hypothetical protein Q9222_002311 [Ikaeria aurantiellina]
MDSQQTGQGLSSPRLLEIIDSLLELNLGDSIQLPQLLVVGDQSSGKSSVLEGVTGLPFPRDSTLCTRFATQISFRRAANAAINISIIPHKDASMEDQDRLKAWKKTGWTSLDQQKFAQVLDEVHEVMGIGGPSEGSNAKGSFSDDILKIEVAGPDQQHLSVVDVPGIFRKITEGVTTQDDITSVRNMVNQYMKNPRSIILAVIPANVDIATQEILDMAKVHDKDEHRTLGVLTKPDLVDKGAEDHVLSLMAGKSHKMSLGWCMVKNPGQQDLKREDKVDRYASEKSFFKTEKPWSSLDKSRVGIVSLRSRLVELLTEIIHTEFGNVRKDVIGDLKMAEKKLEALGPSRVSQSQQRRYLLEIATKFQAITTHAMEARYGADEIFEMSSNLKLATAVVHRDEDFSDDVLRKGLTMRFKDDSFTFTGAASENASEAAEGEEDEAVETRYHFKYDDLEDLLINEDIPAAPGQDIIKWLEHLYKTSRGFEIGGFDPSLIQTMWRKQSSNWRNLALGYTSDIVSITHTYILDLLNILCQDKRVSANLLEAMMEHLTERYKRAMDHTHFILHVENNPWTLNRYFAENLEKSKQQRAKAVMEAKNEVVCDEYGDDIEPKGEGDREQPSSMSNLQNTVLLLHDILKSYYKVARKRFVDNVCMQAADHQLVRGPDTAVKVLSPSFVDDLTADQLEFIAGEDSFTKRERIDLGSQVANLKKARKLLLMG